MEDLHQTGGPNLSAAGYISAVQVCMQDYGCNRMHSTKSTNYGTEVMIESSLTAFSAIYMEDVAYINADLIPILKLWY